jgi:phage I-like protein
LPYDILSLVSARHYFVVDLQQNAIEFSEESSGTWIQALPLGEWSHPIYGRIKITAERVARFVKNFNDRVRGQDLDIDYDHKATTQKAAGWVKQVEDRGLEGLWYFVEWTSEAKKALQEREYRYFSPEFTDEWKQPSTGQVFKDVLFGGGLTNRPFIKEILPINLSDFGHIKYNQGDSNSMNELLKKLAELLGVQLSETDSDDEVVVTKLSEAITSLQEAAKPKQEEDPDLKKLAETNPAIAKLLSDREADRAAILELQARNRLSEVSSMLSEIKSAKWALPPSFLAEIKPTMVALAETHTTKLVAALTKLAETGLVPVGERGSSDPNREENGDLVRQFHEEIGKYTQGEKALSYADAVTKVIEQKPELFDAYNNAQMGVH